MDDPDVIAFVHPDADRVTQQPVIRQRFGPERIDLEARRLDARLRLRRQRSLEQSLADAERRDNHGKGENDSVPRWTHGWLLYRGWVPDRTIRRTIASGSADRQARACAGGPFSFSCPYERRHPPRA